MAARSIALKSLITALLAVVLIMVFAEPASAADEVELSADGTTYASSLAAPLFAGPTLLIPLETREASFWVRNSASFDSVMRISIQGSTWSDAAYASELTVKAAVPGESGVPVRVDTTASCRVLLFDVALDPAEEVEVTISLALGDLDGSAGQLADVGLTLGVTLTQAPGDGDGCSPTVQVPVVVTRPPGGPAPTPTPSSTPTLVPVDEGIDDPPPFVAIAELIANTLAGFDSAFIGWAAAATIAGVLAYLLMAFVRAKNGTDESAVSAEAPALSPKELS
jgi:hypothetical protein